MSSILLGGAAKRLLLYHYDSSSQPSHPKPRCSNHGNSWALVREEQSEKKVAPVEPPLNRRICPIHARQVGLDPSPAFYKTAELFAQPTKAANASCYNSDDYNHHRTVSGVVSPRPLDCVPRRRRNMGCYTLAGRRGIRVPSRAGARSSHRLTPSRDTGAGEKG